jgi:hypothetical protein
VGIALRRLGVDIVPVEGAVAGEGRHRPIHRVEQGADLRAVVGIPVGQHTCNHLAGVGVGGEMQHSCSR